MQSRDTRIRETTIRSGLGPTLQLLVQLCFGLRRENLEIFADAIHASINKLLIQIYDGFFDFSLKYRVGIVGLERRQQSTVLDRTLQLRVQLCFGLRRENLDNFRGCHPYNVFGCVLKCRVGIVGLERRRQSRVLDRTLQLLVQLSFGLRQENLEKFADAIHASINEQLIQKYDSIFDTRIRETTIRSGLGPTLQLLVQLCFGLRRENLEIFADAIHASINKLLIQIYDGFFDFSLKYRVGIVGLERRQQSTVLDRTLQLRVQFLKYRVGIVGFGRRQQIRGLDRPLLLLVQLCFGLRRENLEIFADTIHASINEQLIHIYNCFFGF
ncbi:hypothetical protein V1477_013459 [Vespula maculifrons]|uniref:Uncharacterized protein n=1 Tax=Vespula maculifrons TaxID=7453 RepID=A0ABD2BQ74_VESMC